MKKQVQMQVKCAIPIDEAFLDQLIDIYQNINCQLLLLNATFPADRYAL